MHVLVIGGTRFVGYYLVWRLLASGHRVTLLNRGNFRDPFGDGATRIHGDRAALEQLLGAADRFDAAVDFAAYQGADVEGAVRALRGRCGHYVLVSTGQVYLVRERCPRPAREQDYDGEVMPPPTGAADLSEWEYGVGKRACEDALVAVPDFPSTRIRIPMVNGERDNHRRVESYLWRILDGGPVLLPEPLRRVRHVYGMDVAKAIHALLGEPTTFGQAYNLAQRETPTLAEVVGVLADVVGAPDRVVPVTEAQLAGAGLEPRQVSPFSTRWMSFLDPARAEAELSFRHEPLASYLGRIVMAFLAHPPDQPPESYGRRDAELALAK